TDEIDEWQSQVVNVNRKRLADGCLPKMAAQLVYRPGVNLLQGEYAVRSNIKAMVGPWRTAAGFLLAFIGLSVVGQAAVFFKLRHDDRVLTEQVTEICTERFGTSQLSRCRADMQRRLADAGQTATAGSDGFLDMLAAIAEHADRRMTFESFNFTDRVMRVDVVSPTVGFLDGLDRALTDTGRFDVAVESTNQQDPNNVRARLRVVAVSP
ncbi:MAG: type II secretion system protein GspL, partial [Gammaproteobacteria bacterium]|nr:type II secretion system protein GspL [Gammaproteobacteria bacterium]